MKYRNKILVGDCRKSLNSLPEKSVHCCITSPPYFGLRQYEVEDKSKEIGNETALKEYIDNMVEVSKGVWRVLRDDGTFWLNIGDSRTGGNYRGGSEKTASAKQRSSKGTVDLMARKAPPIPEGLKKKEWMGVPWRLAFALQDAGWYLSDVIIWEKNSMPTSASDRTCRNFEEIFMFTKKPKYFYDQEAIKEPAETQTSESLETRNKRSVWKIAIASVKEAHFACYPPALITPMIKAGTSDYGCCSECGMPYTRIVEKERVPTRPGTDTKVTGDSKKEGNRDPQRHVTKTTTVGWEVACSCNADVSPCIVLDPFFGAGTTGLTCKSLNRSYVGIELSAKYAKMAQQRIIKGV